MTHQEAGRKLVAQYGVEHMRAIGRRGAAAFWKKYHLSPVDIAAFAIVERATGRVVALTNYAGR